MKLNNAPKLRRRRPGEAERWLAARRQARGQTGPVVLRRSGATDTDIALRRADQRAAIAYALDHPVDGLGE